MNSKSNCFIDFDGTIICNKERLYNFFVNNIDRKYIKSLTMEEFWKLKKMGINEIDWINEKYNASIDKEKWNNLKKRNIENSEYLMFNKLFNYSVSALDRIKQLYNLVLVTRRSNAENFMLELKSYNIEKKFSDILIINHNNGSKTDIITKNYSVDDKDIIIGDTEDDLKVAVDLNIVGILVKSGIRSEWVINKYFTNYKKIFCFEDISKIDFNKIKL